MTSRRFGAILLPVASDPELPDRLREALADQSGVIEKRMFGGLGFMLDGHLVAAASSRGGLMLRVDPTDYPALVEHPDAEPFAMHGRAMRGWLLVAVDPSTPDAELHRWVGHGVRYVQTLPPKKPKRS